jgi:hypothetical protein
MSDPHREGILAGRHTATTGKVGPNLTAHRFPLSFVPEFVSSLRLVTGNSQTEKTMPWVELTLAAKGDQKKTAWVNPANVAYVALNPERPDVTEVIPTAGDPLLVKENPEQVIAKFKEVDKP